MRRLASSLLVVLLGLSPAVAAAANPGAALPALHGLAAQSTAAQSTAAQLGARLKRGHAETDAALKLRRERFDAWQQAVLARDEAAATVERMKLAGERGDELEQALRHALVLDEKANIARSRLMAAEAEVAKRGAELLRVYDAVLTLQRREADALPARDPRRERALSTWQALAQQRDKVRRTLGPVLGEREPIDGGADLHVAARPDDDVETLLEKADLARDLEERFLRRAEAVERRIQELVEERAVARDVAGLVQSQSLFDEDDMRLRVVSSDVRGGPSLPSALPGGSGGDGATGGDQLATRGGVSVAEGSRNLDDSAGASDAVPVGPPPAAPGANEAEPGADFGAEAGDDSLAGGAIGTLGPDVGGTLSPRAAERAFTPRTADIDVAALLSSGELTLPELRALQKKLRQRAAEMRAQSQELREQVKERGTR